MSIVSRLDPFEFLASIPIVELYCSISYIRLIHGHCILFHKLFFVGLWLCARYTILRNYTAKNNILFQSAITRTNFIHCRILVYSYFNPKSINSLVIINSILVLQNTKYKKKKITTYKIYLRTTTKKKHTN